MREAVLFAALAVGCGQSTAVSQTSSGVKSPDYAPPTTDEHASHVASADAIPAPTDDAERVVFVREGSLWSMRPDGTEVNEITVRAGKAPDREPAFGPSGTIAFASARDAASKVYLATLEEGIVGALTDGADGGDREPAWSPDGAQVAFVRGDPSVRLDLFVVGAEGGAPTLVMAGDDEHPGQVGAPAWSPDGRTIAFSADRRAGQGTLLWLVDADGSNLRRLTGPRQNAWFIRDARPAWSPDGKRIAFASNRHVASGDNAGDLDIYTVDADGTNLRRLTDDPGVADDPVYSPDGKRLFFASTRERENPYEVEIYVMPATGGDERRMTRDERPQNSAPTTGVAK